jgi:hypothetical protein
MNKYSWTKKDDERDQIRRVRIEKRNSLLIEEITDALMNGGEKSILLNYECWRWERMNS